MSQFKVLGLILAILFVVSLVIDIVAYRVYRQDTSLDTKKMQELQRIYEEKIKNLPACNYDPSDYNRLFQ